MGNFIIENGVLSKYEGHESVVYIPDGVQKIGSWAFASCKEITEIHIPSSVAIIGQGAFEGCNRLFAVHIEDLAAWCMILFDEQNCNPLSMGTHLYMNGEEIKNLVIPDGVQLIGKHCFLGGAFHSVTIPKSVHKIGAFSFYNCKELISITICDGVGAIGAGAFCHCDGVEEITIPSSVKQIGTNAFEGCTGLKTVAILGAAQIDERAFCECQQMASLSLEGAVRNIGDCAFSYCCALQNVVIPGSVNIIGRRAFMGCENLRAVVIENGVVSLDSEVFEDCYNLQDVTIPVSVREIGRLLFAGYLNAKRVYCEVGQKPDEWHQFWDHNAFPEIIWGYRNITTDATYDYVIHDGKAYLTKYKGSHPHVVVPATIDGLPVVSFGSVYAGNTTITSVTIPSSILIVNNGAFGGCSQLETIYCEAECRPEEWGHYWVEESSIHVVWGRR